MVREGCHLCDDMRDALYAFKDELGFDWIEVDVESDAALWRKFDTLVPVLLKADVAICHYFLDSVALRRALAASDGRV